jgi:hypothetical protein
VCPVVRPVFWRLASGPCLLPVCPPVSYRLLAHSSLQAPDSRIARNKPTAKIIDVGSLDSEAGADRPRRGRGADTDAGASVGAGAGGRGAASGVSSAAAAVAKRMGDRSGGRQRGGDGSDDDDGPSSQRGDDENDDDDEGDSQRGGRKQRDGRFEKAGNGRRGGASVGGSSAGDDSTERGEEYEESDEKREQPSSASQASVKLTVTKGDEPAVSFSRDQIHAAFVSATKASVQMKSLLSRVVFFFPSLFFSSTLIGVWDLLASYRLSDCCCSWLVPASRVSLPPRPSHS